MIKTKARTYTYEGNRYYTNTIYTWWDDDSVTIDVIKGDDDWDSYNGTDSGTSTEITFNKLPKNIQQELLADFSKQNVEYSQA